MAWRPPKTAAPAVDPKVYDDKTHCPWCHHEWVIKRRKQVAGMIVRTHCPNCGQWYRQTAGKIER